MIFLLDVMHIIRGDQRQAQLFRPLDQQLVNRVEFANVVLLQLQIKAVAKHLAVPQQLLLGFVDLALFDQTRGFGGQTAAGANDTFGIFF